MAAPAKLKLCMGIVLTAAAGAAGGFVPAIGGALFTALGGAIGRQTIEQVLSATLGVVKDQGVEEAAGTALEHLYERLSDGEVPKDSSGRPLNHHLERASLDAAREAAQVLVIELLGPIDQDASLRERLTRWLKTNRAAAYLGNNAELKWLLALQRHIAGHEFEAWHKTAKLELTDLRSWFEAADGAFRDQFANAFRTWVRSTVEEGHEPERFDSALRDGWPVGNANDARLHVADCYVLFLREFLKTRQEVFNLLVAKQAAELPQKVCDEIDRRLKGFTGIAEERHKELRDALDQLHEALQRLQDGQDQILVGVREVLDDHLRPRQAEERRKIWGLRLESRPPLEPDPSNDLWILRSQCRKLDLIGRDEEWRDLLAWLDDSKRILVKLVTGGAGSGKTRLGLELLWHVDEQRRNKWEAGIIKSEALHGILQNELHQEWRRPMLVLVDHARAADGALKKVLQTLVTRSNEPGPKLRLLLLERSQSATREWIQSLLNVQRNAAPESWIFDPPGRAVLSLPTLTEPRQQFVAALCALDEEELARLVPAANTDQEFESVLKDWADPLFPIMAALVARRQRNVKKCWHIGRYDLAKRMADAELERLEDFAARKGPLDEGLQKFLRHVASLIVLFGGSSQGDAVKLIKEESDCLDPKWPDELGSLKDLLLRAWNDGADDRISCPKVDIVAEAFVLEAFSQTGQQGFSRSALEGHFDKHEREIARLVTHAFHNFQRDATFAPVLASWVNLLVELEMQKREPALIAAVDDAMPLYIAEYFRPLALKLTEARYKAAKAAEVSPSADRDRACDRQAELAELALKLSQRRAWIKPSEEARSAAEEAVAAYEDLYRQAPEIYVEGLAEALNTMSARHANLGCFDEALRPVERAYEMLVELKQQEPGRFELGRQPSLLPLFATTVHTLAMRRVALRQQTAMDTAREAHQLFRQLAELDPLAHVRDLESSLNTLAECCEILCDAGDGLSQAQNAVEQYRLLAGKSRAVFEPGLAAALNFMAGRHLATGQPHGSEGWSAAHDCATECVRLYRQLADREPEMFLAGLASALEQASDIGERRGGIWFDSAMDHARHAVVVRRRLARARPRSFEAGHAMSKVRLASLGLKRVSLTDPRTRDMPPRDMRALARRAAGAAIPVLERAYGALPDGRIAFALAEARVLTNA